MSSAAERLQRAHAQAGTMRAAENPNQPWQGYWEEMFGKSGWMPTAAGVKNAFKVGYHVVDWSKCYLDTWYPADRLPPEMLNFRGAMKDCKNAFGLTELPGKMKKAVSSVFAFLHGPMDVLDRAGNPAHDDQGNPIRTNYIGLGYKATLDLAGVVSPLNDSAEFLHARVAPIASETLKELGQLNAAALLLSMTDSAVKDVATIWRATKILCPSMQSAENYVVQRFGGQGVDVPEEVEADERLEARVVLELQLLDLAKCVSYIALAAIALISAFVVAVPNASFWILVCSTSALAFTIISEFDQRYHRSANRAYPDLPNIGQVNVFRLPEYRAAVARAGGVDVAIPGAARAPRRVVRQEIQAGGMPQGVFASPSVRSAASDADSDHED